MTERERLEREIQEREERRIHEEEMAIIARDESPVEDLESMFAALDRIGLETPVEAATTPPVTEEAFPDPNERQGTGSLWDLSMQELAEYRRTQNERESQGMADRLNAILGRRNRIPNSPVATASSITTATTTTLTGITSTPSRRRSRVSTEEFEDFVARVVEPNKAHMIETLEGYYKDRYHLQPVDIIPETKQVISKIIRNNPDTENPLPNSSDDTMSHRATFYKLYLHFPEVQITDGNMNHTIRDLYVTIKLNYRLQFIDRFKCYRERVTYPEYRCSYTHSHARGRQGPGEMDFCLGSTDLAALDIELMNSAYSKENMEMFLIQLPDYLAWESKQGGPHVALANIYNSAGRNRPNIPTPSPVIMSNVYRTYINNLRVGRFRAEFTARDSGGYPDISITESDQLWKDISSCVDPVMLYDYDPVVRELIYGNIDATLERREIKQLNENYAGHVQFMFGEREVGYSVIEEEIDEKKEKEKKREKRCQKIIMNHIIGELYRDINQFFMYEFKSCTSSNS